MKNMKVVQNCVKWRENSSKQFLAPPPKKRVPKQIFCQNEKNESCSKLPEMARKLVKLIFENRVPKKKLSKMRKNKVGQNCLFLN